MESAHFSKSYLIISDSSDFRQVRRQALANCLTGECLLADTSTAHAIPILHKMQPSLLLIEPGARPLPDLLAPLHKACPTSRHLLFAPAWPESAMCVALLAGAHGCLRLDDSQETWLTALRIVEAGSYWVTPAALAQAFAELSQRQQLEPPHRAAWLEGLTSREREVSAAAMRGFDNKEIARRLGISTATVKTHLHHAFAKLGIVRRSQLLQGEFMTGQDVPPGN